MRNFVSVTIFPAAVNRTKPAQRPGSLHRRKEGRKPGGDGKKRNRIPVPLTPDPRAPNPQPSSRRRV